MNYRVNLLPEELRKAGPRGPKGAALYVFTPLLVISLCLLFFLATLKLEETNSELRSLTEELDNLRPTKTQTQEFNLRQGEVKERINRLSVLLEECKQWSRFLNEINDSVPLGVIVNKIHLYYDPESGTMKKDLALEPEQVKEEHSLEPPPNSLLISGSSESLEVIGKFVFSLTKNKSLASVDLAEIKGSKEGKFSFAITASLKEAKDE